MSRFFVRSVAFLLVLAGLAKLLGTTGGSKVLSDLEPLFRINMRLALLVVGCVEVVTAWILLCARYDPVTKVIPIFWLGLCFAGYRLGLLAIGFRGYCACMGQLFSIFGLSDTAASNILAGLVVYMLAGSFLILARGLFLAAPVTKH